MTDIAPIAVPARDAARRLGVSERQFYLLRRRADFPAARVIGGPRCIRYLISDIDQWIARQPAAEPSPEPPQLARSRRPAGDAGDTEPGRPAPARGAEDGGAVLRRTGRRT